MDRRFDESTANVCGSEHEAVVLKSIRPLLRIPHAVASSWCWGGLVVGSWGWAPGSTAPQPGPTRTAEPQPGLPVVCRGVLVMHGVGIAAVCSCLGWGLRSEVEQGAGCLYWQFENKLHLDSFPARAEHVNVKGS